jgi:hypothetical protein
MNTLFLLFATLGFVNAAVPIPDELKNHYRLIVNQYNTSSCSVEPYNTKYVVNECQSNGTNIPYCCTTMLRSLGYVANEYSFSRCLEGENDTSNFATCEQYYTENQIEYGRIFGYVVLGITCFVVLGVLLWCLRKCCCKNRNEYGQI